MKLSKSVFVLLLMLLPLHAHGKLIFFEPSKGLPDYEKNTPFENTNPSINHELRRSIISATAASIECDSGSVPVPDLYTFTLKSNICKSSDFSRIKSVLVKLAPSLNQESLTFWKTDYFEDGEPELIVGQVDISKDKYFKYPYLSLWLLEFKGNKYKATYAGPFLAGQLHAIEPFGPFNGKRMAFVWHLSCIQCEPWVYLTVVDFSKLPDGAFFEFTYSKDHSGFGHTIEYGLPGMGHSVDAVVESRITTILDSNGPHLIQKFKLLEGKYEWWVFTCKDYKCDYEMYLDNLPKKYIKIWENAERL